MKYQSTRNHALTASPAAAVLRGIAPDGGLYMPEAIPVLDWQSLMKEDTLTMSARILSALLPDYEDMPALVRRGYAGKELPFSKPRWATAMCWSCSGALPAPLRT